MVNKVILVGNVGADPEIRTLESGVKVATIRLATTEYSRNRETQERIDHTEWHRITLWRALADVADKYIRKGSQLYVEGVLRTREWTDQSGNKRYSTEILGNEIKLLGRRGDTPQSEQTTAYQAPQQSYQQPAQQPAQQSAPVPQSEQPYQAPAEPQPVELADDLPF